MIEFVEAITLVSLAVPVYVYLGYPLLLLALARVTPGKPVDKADITPRVSMVVSCFNERDIIEQKLENCLEIDYPDGELEFIFVSDGSDDGTDDVISRYASDRVRLLRQQGRLGKTMGLNLALPTARGDIVVFSDANAMYRPDAVKKLVRNFNDEQVGYVVGAALYEDEEPSAAGRSENAYWTYELAIKRAESRLHSVVGGDGAIYAIRKALYRPLDPEDINDFVNPLQIVAAGFRGVFEAEAVCYEHTAGDFDKEASRKQRIVNRSFNAVMKNRALLNPANSGFFAFELISHKLLRWLSPFFLSLAIIGILVLSQAGIAVYQIGLLILVAITWSILLGELLRANPATPQVLVYPYYFYLVNINSLVGVLKSLRGQVQVAWSTARQEVDREEKSRVLRAAARVLLFLTTLLVLVNTLVAFV